MNTKARHDEIYTAAVAALESAGGQMEVDKLSGDERAAAFRQMYQVVVVATGCHYETAKSNVAKAMRRARYSEMQARWGGSRPGAGRPKTTK